MTPKRIVFSRHAHAEPSRAQLGPGPAEAAFGPFFCILTAGASTLASRLTGNWSHREVIVTTQPCQRARDPSPSAQGTWVRMQTLPRDSCSSLQRGMSNDTSQHWSLYCVLESGSRARTWQPAQCEIGYGVQYHLELGGNDLQNVTSIHISPPSPPPSPSAHWLFSYNTMNVSASLHSAMGAYFGCGRLSTVG